MYRLKHDSFLFSMFRSYYYPKPMCQFILPSLTKKYLALDLLCMYRTHILLHSPKFQENKKDFECCVTNGTALPNIRGIWLL